MNSTENDNRNTQKFQKNLNETLEEKEKLKNILSSTKTECNLLKSQIESATEELRKVNKEIQDIQIKKKLLIKKQAIRRQREQKAQKDLYLLISNKQKIEDSIKVERENSLNERIHQLQECIKYSEDHWIFRYFSDRNFEDEPQKEEIEGNEIVLIENKQI
ncbi:hypothetical protein MS3_00007839 [Schistosoma haematobium]|uniref:Uncharacterized protein n=2 Tax=Schistosoma haematobium TaxID=6185 RepID=A0A922S5N3_SCHHA|nr:hypothetical protein MS3_00007839 [Schistosoma haematobium]KAH9594710.1 hypothetical protein MS3_00007839 [Schistosoma haematobium]CAH8450193.1 unnamed protein product [Schistosoma haematobium]CAH8450398.1 unnamed protein product [Schistosoma haematobium]